MEKEIFTENEKFERRIKSYRTIIECLHDELAIAVMTNDRIYAHDLHKTIWDLRDKISNLSKQLNKFDITD